MAKGSGGGRKLKPRDPMTTKTGKRRLGPLNLVQLEDMLAKESRNKNKGKILNRIRILKQREIKNGKVDHTEPTQEERS
jgi:hypothetical protein